MEIDWMSEEWINETQRIMSNEDGKRFKKFYSQIKKHARESAKRNMCLLCGKKCTSFCKSHTVPQFALKNIASNGNLFLFNSLAKNAFIDYDSGVSNAGNFYLICNDCDNTIFQDYENDSVLRKLKKEDIKAYNEMALKNLLKALYKRNLEVEQYKYMSDICRNEMDSQAGGIYNVLLNSIDKLSQRKLFVSELDVSEYNDEIIKCRKALNKCQKGNDFPHNNPYYNIIDIITLPYTVPIAYQGVLTLVTDITGEIINDLYCDDPKYKQELLHLCIFPLDNFSLITLFTHKSNKRYRKFKSDFLMLSLEDKLSLINFILFLYSEDMFLSGYLDIKTINTAEFQRIIRTNPTDNFGSTSKNELKKTATMKAMEKFSLKNHKAINNLLDREFAIENLSK